MAKFVVSVDFIAGICGIFLEMSFKASWAKAGFQGTAKTAGEEEGREGSWGKMWAVM